MQILRAKLYEMKLREQQDEVKSRRLAQVGTGSRSEKIRTYNYKDNRATDHRLGKISRSIVFWKVILRGLFRLAFLRISRNVWLSWQLLLIDGVMGD